MLQDEAATPYLNACQYAAKSSEFFKHFKSHPAYTHVLEHVSYEEGQQYLKEIEIDYLDKLQEIKQNDAIGEPQTYEYPSIGNISPTTIRYVKNTSDIINKFGTSFDSIVEIGADQPRVISNTYLLENNFDWSGVSFELDTDKVTYFNSIRKNKCFCEDATSYDYKSLFEERNYPKQIDYLQLDIDPAEGTLRALKVLPLNDYRFSVITYETDVYSSGADIQDEQIEILESHGYQLVAKNVKCEGNPYEDWWIDPAIISEDVWKPYKTRIGLESNEVILL
jgi:hypothetical protein